MAMGYGPLCTAENRQHAEEGSNNSSVVPEELVPCTGWHALCSGSTDCRMNGDTADCDCWRVNETHFVATSEIQDPTLKRQTRIRCTNKHPCDIDEAPVCQAIRDGQYEVDAVKYQWVSTFSYRGWCELYKPKACDQQAEGYSGDAYWAFCDVAPCTESVNPSDPDRPLSCQCRVDDSPFVGTKDSCTGDSGGIISAMPLWVWDFENDTWRISAPGYDQVKSACAPLGSDPLPQ
jgi:hypothetical protein